MTTWLSDASANRHIKTYVKDFLDVSGNFIVRSAPTSTALTSSGTNWQAKGQVLAGPDRNDTTIHFGIDIDMDASGNTFAVGTPYYNYSHHNGAVQVFLYDASAQVWYQKGNTIHSPNYNSDNQFGIHVKMSSDGNRILIVDHTYNGSFGNIVIVDYNSSTNNWDEVQNRTGASNEYLGIRGASLSGNGLVYSLSTNPDNSRIYRWDGSSWGSAIQWNDYTYFSLNYDGNIVVTYHESANTYKVFEWDGSSYVQKGANIYVPNSSFTYNQGTDINDEGNIIAIVVPAHDMIGVYKYDSTSNSWLQHGSYLYGRLFSGTDTEPGIYNQRNRVRLNGAGDHIIYGSTTYRDAYVYKYDNDMNDWVMVPSPTGGTGSGRGVGTTGSSIVLDSYIRAPEEEYDNDEEFGASCAISDDGTKIIVSAPNANIKYASSGAVYAFELGEPPATTPAVSSTLDHKQRFDAIDISNGNLSFNKVTTGESIFTGEKLEPSDTTYQQQYGLGVAMNGDGNIIAIGAPHGTNANNGNTKAGYVEVKQYINGSWSPLGNTIYGNWLDYYFGVRVDLNDSGTRLMVSAAADSNLYRGAIEVYDLSGTSWVSVGNRIDGIIVNNQFSYSGGIDMNSAGDIIVGAANYTTGVVRAYQYVDASSDWVQLGSDITIDSHGSSDPYGNRVALNDDGTILAVGDKSNDTIGTNDGMVRVYKFTNGSWNQFGGNIHTIAFGNTDEFGVNVSLSADGYTLFTSSPWYASSVGEGRAYKYSEDADKWVELGPPINPDTMYNEGGERLGDASYISKDGSIVAINESHHDWGGTNRGALHMFKYTEGYWKQIGTGYFHDFGATNNSYPGWWSRSLSMNRDGTRIIVGAASEDGAASDSGAAYVLELKESGIVTGSVEPLLTANANTQTASLPVFEIASNGSDTTWLKDRFDNDYNIMSWSSAGGSYITPNNTDGISLYSLNSRRASLSSKGVLRIAGGGWDFTPAHSDYYEMRHGYGAFYNRKNTIHNSSLAVDGSIGCSTYIGVVSIYSDKRIKTNIQTIDDASALEKLRLLNPCTYEYIDKLERGTDIVEGFIAQEVREVIPAAIKYTTYEIPNIYKVGSYSVDASGNHFFTIPDYDTATLELDPSGNIFPGLMVYDYNHTSLGSINIIKVVSSTVLQVELVDKQDKIVPKDIFVYGQFISNILILDKDKIFTVATAAMQEIDRLLQADKAKTATMESQVTDLLARVTALENK